MNHLILLGQIMVAKKTSEIYVNRPFFFSILRTTTQLHKQNKISKKLVIEI